MRTVRISSILTAALVAAVVFSSVAQGQRARESLSERVARLEQQIRGDDDASRTLSDLVLQLGQLQTEIRELRGMVEQQNFEIENLRSAQRDQYLDLDRRLSEANRGVIDPQRSVRSGFPIDLPTTDMPAGDDDSPRPVRTADDYPEVRAPVEADLQTSGLGDDGPQSVAAVVDPVAEKMDYDRAFEALKNGRYAEAARLFDAFVDQYPNGDYSDNAQYWLAESYYVTGNYRIALDAFQALLNRFPNSGKAPDAKLKLGYTYFSLKEWRAAEQVLRQVVTEYPDTTVARLAENRLRAMRLEGHIQ